MLIGASLAHYQVTALLGKGGMGEVYRASDTKLGRDIALKVLPQEFSGDSHRTARFRREARTLASLQHPNVASIYDFEEVDGVHLLAMELVEGEDLAQRLSRGPLAVDEALNVAHQMAIGLEAAHEKNIVHRDLKPANVKVDPDGVVKILDFGLARAYAGDPADPNDVGESPTVTTGMTQSGVLLGTPAYMAPEQARGQRVDKRADIWALGCCLYECLTGAKPFQGETPADLLAEIVKSEPDWARLPAETPNRVRVLLWRCLQKDPKRRLRDVGEVRFELSGSDSDPSGVLPALGTTASAAAPSRRALVLTASIALFCGATLAGVAVWLALKPDPGVVSAVRLEATPKRFEIDIGTTAPLMIQNVSAEVTISPDGRRFAYAANLDGTKRLYLRDLAATEAVELAGTENAWRPFFSPDGQWVGFFLPGAPASRRGKLVKISVSGGNPVEICNAFPPAGATWLQDGSIVFTSQDDDIDPGLHPFQSFLFQVDEDGGTPSRLSGPGELAKEVWFHGLPSPVGDGDFLLFSVVGERNRRDTALLDMKTGAYETLVTDALNAQYVPSGHIVFARGTSLWAVTFDIDARAVGEPFIVERNIQTNLQASVAAFAVSTDGSLIYVPTAVARETQRTLVWVDHDGREETVAIPPGKYWWPRVSPDGSRVALSIQGSRDGNEDIWIHEFDRSQSLRRFTFDPALDSNPLWSPSGRHIYFTSKRKGSGDIYRRRADGTGAVAPIHSGSRFEYSADITAGETKLLFGREHAETGWDIEEIDLGHARSDVAEDTRSSDAVRVLLNSDFNEGGARLSPTGKWLAYNTDETEPIQVYVRPYPNLDDGRWQISTDGGVNPSWSADGKEIYYRTGTRMMAVAVETEPVFRPGRPRELFDAEYFVAPDLSVQYDLEYPSRRRFLMIKPLPDARTTRLVYVDDWFAELERLTPDQDARTP